MTDSLLHLEDPVAAVEFTRDGRGFLFQLAGNIGFKDLTADTINPELVAFEETTQGNPKLSPDGRWLAFQSNHTGTTEVYVVPFPDVTYGFERVSRDGGSAPVWAPEGQNELFYSDPGQWITAATYSADSVFTVESWERLFHAGAFFRPNNGRSYDVSPSGDRFIMIHRDPAALGLKEPVTPRLILIQNFFTLIEERLGGVP